MTEEKKPDDNKREKVSDEEMEDVAGGVIDLTGEARNRPRPRKKTDFGSGDNDHGDTN